MSDRSGVVYQKGKPPLRKGAGRGAYSKHLALRNDKGQFQKVPRRDLSIVLMCGYVKSSTIIIGENMKTVRMGIERGLVRAMIEMLPKTAMLTGKMRRILQLASQEIARTKTSAFSTRVTIDMKDVKELASAIENYIRYHINPGSPFGYSYQDPTTKDTVPFDLLELQSRATINVVQEIRSAQRNAGLAIR